MKVLLGPVKPVHGCQEIAIGGSKSESNRLLILKALYPDLTIKNISNSDDTVLLQKALENTSNSVIDIHHAGTAMRFLTALFASRDGREVILTGSDRMQQRPIAILVDALRKMGANIEYLKNEGFPPIKIIGTKLTASQVSLEAGTSSQYISALLLIAPSLENGLEVHLEGPVTSRPYIDMTCHLLEQIGCKVDFHGNNIKVAPLRSPAPKTLAVESDWSSASYFFSMVALSSELSLRLKTYRQSSLQGDAELTDIYRLLGVESTFNPEDHSISISKTDETVLDTIRLNLIKTPDIAQTIAVTCYGLGLGCELAGLQTLKIKETDRLLALKNELEKFGARVDITENSLKLYPSEAIKKNISVSTYNDHRMAMAFAPLAMKTHLVIEDAGVVSKSFPEFWNLASLAGISVRIER